MKTYNSPGQARSLREIEAAAMTPVTQIIKEIDGTVQPVQAPIEKEEKEARPEAEAKVPSKKTRAKKKAEEV